MKINWYVIALLFLVACTGDFKPKPKGLNHIELPGHEYQLLNDSDKPYNFEYSKSAVAVDDTTGLKRKKKGYKVITYPGFNSSIHITYKSIKGNQDSLDSYINEAYRLAYGHDVKAYGITPETIVSEKGIATLITIEGEVPSQYQFFVHDSTSHFLRGAVYFDTASKNDSLAPVIQYMKDDVHHMLNTLEWKE